MASRSAALPRATAPGHVVEPGFPGVAEAQCLSDTCGAVPPALCLPGEAPLVLPPLWERMGGSLGVRRAEAGSSVPVPWRPVSVTAPAGGDGVCSAAPPSGAGTSPSPPLVAWNVGYLSTWD